MRICRVKKKIDETHRLMKCTVCGSEHVAEITPNPYRVDGRGWKTLPGGRVCKNPLCGSPGIKAAEHATRVADRMGEYANVEGYDTPALYLKAASGLTMPDDPMADSALYDPPVEMYRKCRECDKPALPGFLPPSVLCDDHSGRWTQEKAEQCERERIARGFGFGGNRATKFPASHVSTSPAQ